MSNRLRQIFLPLTIITSILALIHLLIYQVLLPDLPELWRNPVLIMMILGLVSIPLGLIFSQGPLRKQLRFITKFAYFWIGFFFLTFSFVLIQIFTLFFFEHEYSYWPLIAAFLAAAWSIYWALSPPRIVTYKLSGPSVMKGISLVP